MESIQIYKLLKLLIYFNKFLLFDQYSQNEKNNNVFQFVGEWLSHSPEDVYILEKGRWSTNSKNIN